MGFWGQLSPGWSLGLCVYTTIKVGCCVAVPSLRPHLSRAGRAPLKGGERQVWMLVPLSLPVARVRSRLPGQRQNLALLGTSPFPEVREIQFGGDLVQSGFPSCLALCRLGTKLKVLSPSHPHTPISLKPSQAKGLALRPGPGGGSGSRLCRV